MLFCVNGLESDTLCGVFEGMKICSVVHLIESFLPVSTTDRFPFSVQDTGEIKCPALPLQ